MQYIVHVALEELLRTDRMFLETHFPSFELYCVLTVIRRWAGVLAIETLVDELGM